VIKVISATKNQVVMEVKGDQEEFMESLLELKSIPKEDRVFTQGQWTISHPKKYTHIKAIQSALDDVENQLRFF
jgi:hypothetical protein